MSSSTSLQSPITVYYHTHWDREWYRTYRDYQLRLAQVVDTVLDQVADGSLPCFSLDGQTVILEDYGQLRPHRMAELRQAIVQGTLSIGPWYIMADEFLVSGESLWRNLYRGIAMATEAGCHEFTGYVPDPFGHPDSLPTILNHFGIETFIGWRGFNPPQDLFWWQSPSGSKLLCYHLKAGYFINMLHEPAWAGDTEKQQTLIRETVKQIQPHQPNLPVLFPVGGDHLGPITGESRHLLQQTLLPLTPSGALQESHPATFMAHLTATLDEATRQSLPTVSGEQVDNTQAYILHGVYSARLYLKQANRRAEHKLTALLEPLATLASGYGYPYPHTELETAWQLLLLNQPHDSICGCSLDEVHRQNEARYEDLHHLLDGLMTRICHFLNTTLTEPHQWLLWHMGDRPYTGVVEVVERINTGKRELLVPGAQSEAGYLEKVLASVPPSAITQVDTTAIVFDDDYQTNLNQNAYPDHTMIERRGFIWVEELLPRSVSARSRNDSPHYTPVTVTPGSLDNAHVRLTLEADGTLTLTDLVSKKSQHGFLRFTSRDEQGDSYNGAPVPGSSYHAAEFRQGSILRHGPLVGSLQLFHTLKHPSHPEVLELITIITLKARESLVEAHTHWTNPWPNHKLQVWFETGAPISTVTAETHYGVVERTYNPAHTMESQMPIPAGKEIVPNTGPIQRFIEANGIRWVTEGLTEYEVVHNDVALTLFRGFEYLSHPETGVRGGNAGPSFHTPEGNSFNRPFSFRYGFQLAGDGTSAGFETALRFYGVTSGEQGRVSQPDPRPGSAKGIPFIQWDNPNVISSALYQLETPPQSQSSTQTWVLRVFNPTAKAQPLILKVSLPHATVQSIDELDGTHQVVREGLGGPLSVPPFQVMTLGLRVHQQD